MNQWRPTVWILILSVVIASVVNWLLWGHHFSYQVITWVNDVEAESYDEQFSTDVQIFFTLMVGKFEGGLFTVIVDLALRARRRFSAEGGKR